MNDDLCTRVEAVLRHVNPDAQTTVHRLIEKFGSISAAADADLLNVADALGGDMSTSLYIKLVCALISRRRCDLFKFGKKHSDEEIESYLISLFLGLSVETVYLLSLRGGKVVSCERVGEGTVNTSNVLPRKLIEIAKRNMADSVIIAHNHPGGYASPSDDDVAGTRMLRECFASAGVKMLSHYVVAGSGCRKVDVDYHGRI